jgi:hypothetical protein
VQEIGFAEVESWAELHDAFERGVEEQTFIEVTEADHRPWADGESDELLHALAVARHQTASQKFKNRLDLVFVTDYETETVLDDLRLFLDHLVDADRQAGLQIDVPGSQRRLLLEGLCLHRVVGGRGLGDLD